MIFVVAAVVGYVIGAINPASIIARIKGVDYRSVGSGNPGATNIGRALGKKTGVLVGILDVLKGFLPAIAFRLYADDLAVAEIAGFAAILGHVTSPFLKGRGGKGVATSAGAILAIEPLWLIPVLVVFGVIFKLSRRMGIASVSAGLTLIPASLVWHQQNSEIIFAVAMAALVVFRHQSNIRAALAARLNK
ncbi:MAG: glycerol-3-phosphate 1-O-acyltransferase PlsY [Candidatus Nanopelagicales bacterium]|nr:glycerol-3-phosphate 1-O-acyltransferase PlsY [Candidatus Nanopelagicales bacterium]